jgi:hypothetical protein
MKKETKCFIGLLAALSVFAAMNLIHFLRPLTCWDCFFPYGLPFTFFHEGGFAGGRGLLADLLIALIVGAAIGSAWIGFSERDSSDRRRQ